MSYRLQTKDFETECSITDSEFTFKTQQKEKVEKVAIDVVDIIGVEECQGQPKKDQHQVEVKVHFIQKIKTPKWSKETVLLKGDPSVCTAFVSDIKSKLDKVVQRPKCLLVIVNPIGGAKKGRNVHENIVDPLFKLANIRTDVIFSERPNHVTDIIASYDFSKVDGIVICGGDGTYQECINSLFKRIQSEAGIDYNNPDVQPKEIFLPIGLVPTGTGNGIAESCYGCYDHETAVLHIIRGHTRQRMIGGVFCENKLISYFGLLAAYGLFCDLMYSTDKQRWLSRARYFVMPIYHFLIKKQRELNLEITAYCKESARSLKDTKEAGQKGEDSQDVYPNETTKTFIGRYTNVTLFVPDLMDDENNMDTDCRRDDKRMDCSTLIMFKKCGGLSLIRFLAQMFRKDPDAMRKDFIETLKITGFKVRLKEEASNEAASPLQPLNLKIELDGEVVQLTKPEFEIRLFFQTVSLFSS